MPKSYYLCNKSLDAVFRNTPYTSPVQVYVALFTTAPTLITPGTEVSGGSYARQTTTWTAPSNGQIANAADIVYPVATAAWGTVTSFGIYDAPSGGNLLYYNNLTASRTVNISDQFKFVAGAIVALES